MDYYQEWIFYVRDLPIPDTKGAWFYDSQNKKWVWVK